jgi:hypothetical protein
MVSSWFESKAGMGSEFHFSVPMQTNGAGSREKWVEATPVAMR